jgi:surfeit locus 1 family protein
MLRSRLRGSLVLPALFAAAAFATFIGLGTWQIQRKAWKESLIGTLGARLSASPIALPPRDRWPDLNPAADEFLRVRFSGAFIPGEEALVYTSGSAFRPDVSGPGYWVFAPARLESGGVVVVNRGFVPEGRRDSAGRADGAMAGPLQMVGVLRWPETAAWFAPKPDPGRNLWFVRDPLAIAATKGWPGVAPFFVELESPQPPGGLPRAGPLKASLRNEHLQYALTWYALAVVVVVMFAFWLYGRWSDAKG